MKANVKMYLQDGVNKENEYSIKIILTHKNKIKRKTIAKSKMDHWNTEKELPNINHPRFDELYEEILLIRKRTQKTAFKILNDKAEAIEFLTTEELKDKSYDFFKFSDELIASLRDTNYGNSVAYNTAVNQLKLYKSKLSFRDITPQLLENFKIWKKESGAQNSTISIYYRTLRAIYNKGVLKYSLSNEYPFKGLFQSIPVRKVRKKNRWIDKSSMRKLAIANLINKRDIESRDLTLLQFYLGGQDLMDIYYLKKNQFYKDRVMLRRMKLGDKAYEFDVKVFPEAMEIINKYKTTDNDYVFPFRKNPVGYKTFRGNHTKFTEKIRSSSITNK
jgi:hypothetical protein